MYDAFKSRMSVCGAYEGEARNSHAKNIMDVSFKRDPAYKKCWIIDKGTHFPEQTLASYKKAKAVFSGKDTYDPCKLKGFKEIDAKYLVHSYYSIQGDAVDYYLEFRPDAHGVNKNICIGAYVFIPDDLGIYNLWMIVAKDDRPIFPQFYILRVNMLLKWYIGENEVPLFEGTNVDVGSYFAWAIQRTQSSYNSGVWTDYATTSVENQLKAILPTNNDTNTIVYNEHFIISNNPLRRIAWEVSKVEDTTTFGLTKLTFKQELEYDPVDNMSWINLTSENYSDSSNGIDYDFYKSRSKTYPSEEEIETMAISCSGVTSSIKVGGGYKTLTAINFEDGNIPSWSIGYKKQNSIVCQISLSYTNGNFVCNTNNNSNIIIDGNKIRYQDDNGNVFGIEYKYDSTKSNCIQIRCLKVLDMIGNKLLVSIGESLNQSNALEMEVEGL